MEDPVPWTKLAHTHDKVFGCWLVATNVRRIRYSAHNRGEGMEELREAPIRKHRMSTSLKGSRLRRVGRRAGWMDPEFRFLGSGGLCVLAIPPR